ncbi:SulP family inorganic anion transporter [Halomonas daqingensis]|uniref:SulP family inorganic anion transporter n=1 Tax=Billgrantia desiderata TaxID=52021 RepID=A0ABS9B4U1_9GAMM|nr:SulP family inorganic anion transporter [Halomonas desiderata]MCE8042338.1 SulP family inorganic anion transporter [Halomonas desiderata]MCE8046913.1 SulP family inorganic anion transporter [Halomonas desiderata]
MSAHWLVRLLPCLTWLPDVGRRTLRADLMAGLTGAVIVLPQGVAYALIAGLPPQYGLYGAIVIAIVSALFGSSRHLVSGPTAALSIVVFSVVSGVVSPESPEFIPYVITVTLLAGIFQLGLGIAKLGGLVNFISHTVVVGFTTGAAVLIATSQLRHFFGLDIPSGQPFLTTITMVVQQLPTMNPWVVLVGCVTLLTSLLVSRYRPAWPSMLVAMLVGSILAWSIGGAERGITMVGALPASLPPFSMPVFSLDTLRMLASGALAVAIIGLIEAVSIGRAISSRTGHRIDGNQEFIGQGLGNIVGSFFSCYAGSGSFTRSAANYQAGACTPLSVVFAATLVLITMMLAPGLTSHLPMPAMAAIVLLIAWKLVDIKQIREVIITSRSEAAILAVTFSSTLILALEFAIYLGVLLSLGLYLKRTARPPLVPVKPELDMAHRSGGKPCKNCEQYDNLRILRVDGSLFFGAVDHVRLSLDRHTEDGCRHIVLVGHGVNFIDYAGAELLVEQDARLRALGGKLYFCSFKTAVLSFLHKPRYHELLKEAEFFESLEEVLERISNTQHSCACQRGVRPSEGGTKLARSNG